MFLIYCDYYFCFVFVMKCETQTANVVVSAFNIKRGLFLQFNQGVRCQYLNTFLINGVHVVKDQGVRTAVRSENSRQSYSF